MAQLKIDPGSPKVKHDLKDKVADVLEAISTGGVSVVIKTTKKGRPE